MIKLIKIITKSNIFLEAVNFLKKSSVPNWFICAGFIQQIYFNCNHSYNIHQNIKDIDVAFYNPLDISEAYEKQIEKELGSILSGTSLKPDVKNQAGVHLWYKKMFGYKINPYYDIFDAIDTFPTTTTAIGIRCKKGQYFVYSTFGLSDLYKMILRPNKRQITKEIYDKKKKRVAKNWPKVKIIEWKS